MTLILCSVCGRDVSADASICPNCGHPITKKARRAFGVFVLLVTSILVVAALAAMTTKPSESALRNALVEKYGLIYGAGAVAEHYGLLKLRYNDHFLYSSLSVSLIGTPEQTVAYGYFGKTVVADIPPLGLGGNDFSPSPTP